jgi:hypothetical protein
MPDWLTINLAQTIVLMIAAWLAFVTYRANRRDRLNQIDERHLLNVADWISEVSASAEEAKWGGQSGERMRLQKAQKRLSLALQFVEPYFEELRTCQKLVEADPNLHSEITDILAPISAGEVADVIRGLPQGAWFIPRWLRRLNYGDVRRWVLIRAHEPGRKRRQKRHDDEGDGIIEA